MVRCADCGYLCVFKRGGADELIGVPRPVRENWNERNGPFRDFWEHNHAACVCFVEALPEDDRRQAQAGALEAQRIMMKDRECPSFVRWFQGHSPKEHKEMIDAEKQREWQEARRKDDLTFQEEVRRHNAERLEAQREEDQRRAEAQRKEDRQLQQEQKRSDRRWSLIMLLLGTLIGIVSTVASSWISQLAQVKTEKRDR